ncbi:MAG TPA: cytochrome c family protein [Candidatus Sulfotelmatobacter sp.]|nr:cytochrome c family protein [Candidatus Sulfotelmatobacter sp.]
MSSFELNKIAAAILLAGIVAMVSSFIAEGLVKPKPIEKPGYVVAGGEAKPEAAAGGGAPKAEEIPPIAPLLAKADPAEGEKIFKQCAACHTVDKGGPNRIGPNLYGVIGSHPAEVAGFTFSKALEGIKDKVWDYEELNKWLTKPQAYAPGTKMTFAGLRKPEQRADVIAFLRTKSDSPPPLP